MDFWDKLINLEFPRRTFNQLTLKVMGAAGVNPQLSLIPELKTLPLDADKQLAESLEQLPLAKVLKQLDRTINSFFCWNLGQTAEPEHYDEKVTNDLSIKISHNKETGLYLPDSYHARIPEGKLKKIFLLVQRIKKDKRVLLRSITRGALDYPKKEDEDGDFDQDKFDVVRDHNLLVEAIKSGEESCLALFLDQFSSQGVDDFFRTNPDAINSFEKFKISFSAYFQEHLNICNRQDRLLILKHGNINDPQQKFLKSVFKASPQNGETRETNLNKFSEEQERKRVEAISKLTAQILGPGQILAQQINSLKPSESR